MLEINAAFNSRNVDRIMSFFAEDCTFFMARGPEPCGRRVHGKEAVRRALAERFKVIPDMRWDHPSGLQMRRSCVARSVTSSAMIVPPF